MIAIINNNGTLARAKASFNNGGSLVSENGLNIAYNLDGEILTYPKKENMILNLNPQSWLLNTIADSNYLCDTTFTLQQLTPTSNGTFGNYNPQVPTSGGAKNVLGVSNGADKYWLIGNVWDHATIRFTDNLYSNAGKLTISATFKAPQGWGGISAWTGMIGTFNNNNLRIEKGNNNFVFAGVNTPQVTLDRVSDITQYSTLTMVIDGRTITLYQNYQYVSQVSCNADNESWTDLNFNSRQPGGSFAGNICWKSIRIWKDALTAQDLAMVQKLENLGF